MVSYHDVCSDCVHLYEKNKMLREGRKRGGLPGQLGLLSAASNRNLAEVAQIGICLLNIIYCGVCFFILTQLLRDVIKAQI